jgi:hypothetical protein
MKNVVFVKDKDGHLVPVSREDASKDPVILVFDIDEKELARVGHCNLGSCETQEEIRVWQAYVKLSRSGVSLVEDKIMLSLLEPALTAPVVSGRLCENNDYVDQSGAVPSSVPFATEGGGGGGGGGGGDVGTVGRHQTAFKPGSGMRFISLGDPTCGVVAMYMLRDTLSRKYLSSWYT